MERKWNIMTDLINDPGDMKIYENRIYIIDKKDNILYESTPDINVEDDLLTIKEEQWQSAEYSLGRENSNPSGVSIANDRIYISDSKDKKVYFTDSLSL